MRPNIAAAGLISAVLLLSGCATLPLREPSAALPIRVERYREQAGRVRGLTLATEISLERETRAELLASLERELDKPENRLQLRELELLLRQLRVVPREADLRALMLALMQDQVAAYYDPEEKRLVYVDTPEGAVKGAAGFDQAMQERFIYVHEFCHALEDSHYNLEALMKAAQSDLDSSLALTAFSEGNAVLAGIDSVLDSSGRPTSSGAPLPAWLLGLLGSLGLERAADELEGVPPFLASAMLRPYLDGTVFSNRIRREAGWGALDRIYRNGPPTTTAEILYPEHRFLRGFQAACFDLPAELLPADGQGGLTNRLGVMGTALWLNGDSWQSPARYGFLKYWLGDRIVVLPGVDGSASTVWLSLWDGKCAARRFSREAEKRLRQDFADIPYKVHRGGSMVVVVWSPRGEGGRDNCERLVQSALLAGVECGSRSGWLGRTARACPWPLRLPVYPGHGAGCDLLGGYLLHGSAGQEFMATSLAAGLLRLERNPERHDYSLAWGLLCHKGDKNCDFTYWKAPLLFSFHRRGHGENHRLHWKLLWGVLADGSEKRVRLLRLPVWRHTPKVAADAGRTEATN